VAHEIFVITIITKAFELAFNHFMVNFWIFSGVERVVGFIGLGRGIKEGF
jgi:hypothetical protein